MTDDILEERAKQFIAQLGELTENFLRGMPQETFGAQAAELKALFDSFAIIDEFTSWGIVDCLNAIKISRMKLERFARGKKGMSAKTAAFKALLAQMHDAMYDLYRYEIFGFFSTRIEPRKVFGKELPCRIFCGCADGWQLEPYLDKDGNAAYANVIRFEDSVSKEFFCITISEEPEFLGQRKKCSLTDSQIDALKSFVVNNLDIIILHCSGVISSGEIYNALELKDRPQTGASLCRLVCKVNGVDRFVDMSCKDFKQEKKFYKSLAKEYAAERKKNDACSKKQFSYRIEGIKVLQIKGD